ncbi:hypothetical protein BC829DRAFT_388825, partial [Chytridium lagenaria]
MRYLPSIIIYWIFPAPPPTFISSAAPTCRNFTTIPSIFTLPTPSGTIVERVIGLAPRSSTFRTIIQTPPLIFISRGFADETTVDHPGSTHSSSGEKTIRPSLMPLQRSATMMLGHPGRMGRMMSSKVGEWEGVP